MQMVIFIIVVGMEITQNFAGYHLDAGLVGSEPQSMIPNQFKEETEIINIQ